MLTILKLITALLQAIPALKGLVSLAMEQLDKANEQEAIERKNKKDIAVDNAIDGNSKNEINTDTN